GRAGARDALDKFWRDISSYALFSPYQRGPLLRLFGVWNLDRAPVTIWSDLMTRFFSPYDLNITDYNPLRSYLAKTIDFDKVNACKETQLFVSATNVYTGRIQVFDNYEKCNVTLDAVMASACIPTLYKAVEIGKVPYWDGGYMGNPALWP